MSTTEHISRDKSTSCSQETANKARIAVVVSEWNQDVTFSLLHGALETLVRLGVNEDRICVFYVPGSFELVFASSKIINAKAADAVITLGCVVRGETPHFDYVCQGVTQGISELNAEGKAPVIFGLLTTDNMQQALDRAGGNLGNKGSECAITALKMLDFAWSLKDK